MCLGAEFKMLMIYQSVCLQMEHLLRLLRVSVECDHVDGDCCAFGAGRFLWEKFAGELFKIQKCSRPARCSACARQWRRRRNGSQTMVSEACALLVPVLLVPLSLAATCANINLR